MYWNAIVFITASESFNLLSFLTFNPMHFSYFQYHQWQRNLFKNFLLFLQEDELHDLTFISKHMT